MIRIESLAPTASGNKLKAVLSDGSSVYIDAETAARYHLNAGEEYDLELFEEILSNSRYNTAKNRALNILGYRARSEKELFDRLCEKTDEDTAAAVVDKMRDIGLVNDRALLCDKLQNLLVIKKYGIRRAINELSLKGFEREDIEQAIEDMEYDEYSSLCELIDAKYADELCDCDIKTRQRVIAALLRRGFSYDDIKSAISEIV